MIAVMAKNGRKRSICPIREEGMHREGERQEERMGEEIE